MSISSNLERINGAKSTLKTYLTDNNVAVPDGTKIDAMAELLNGVSVDKINHADIPDYVKAEALAVVEKVKAVMKADSIVFLSVSDFEVEEVAAGLFHFVEEDDAVRFFPDGIGQFAAFFIADVARRRADHA